MKELHEHVAVIARKEDLVSFIQTLRDDLVAHPEQWENSSLETFLDALASWTEDMEGYYRNRNEPIPQPTWKMFGEMLAAARTYE